MNGHIIPNSNIAVDFWKIKGRQDNLIHFLTHLHGDHIVGLTSTWNKPIYCSIITAELLKSKYGISNKLLHILPLNESVVIDTPSFRSFSVTAFDANHCPGAVMFYFQGHFGNIFYTGDFRASQSLIKSCLYLKEMVDVLYLDNTYCSQKCVFPSQEECFDKIVEIIRQHPDRSVLIGVRSLGKEFMLGRLGAALNETIAVPPDMYKICHNLFDTNVFTTSQLNKQSRIRAIPLQDLTRAYWQDPKHCIAIKPTALFTGQNGRNVNRSNIFVVPYSDHSSYTELLDFVSVLKPGSVLPIVTGTKGIFGTDISDRTDMSCFEPFLSTGSPNHESSTFESSLLINGPRELLYECETNARRQLQGMGDGTFYCNIKVFTDNTTETSAQKLKRKQKPTNRKKNLTNRKKIKPSPIIYEDSGSEESTDQTPPSPEPKQNQ